ncbi:MAG: Sirohydrochlorin cobaltochelatase [Candidatus Omnitrophica bacterium]|nr:Sirohydrochlorin cobaltochelatase [Candidatus Omnitrophota bacterium]
MKRSSAKPAVVLVAHGSRAAGFDRPVKRLAASLRRDGRYHSVHVAYLEITAPDVATAIGQALSSGASSVRVLPYFLLGGRHVQEDLPRLCARARVLHRGADIKLCPYLGFHEKIVSVVHERLRRPF